MKKSREQCRGTSSRRGIFEQYQTEGFSILAADWSVYTPGGGHSGHNPQHGSRMTPQFRRDLGSRFASSTHGRDPHRISLARPAGWPRKERLDVASQFAREPALQAATQQVAGFVARGHSVSTIPFCHFREYFRCLP
jgi:hypothetical protein